MAGRGATHEHDTARELHAELDGADVVALHTTASEPSPFAVAQGLTDREAELARYTGVDRLIDMDGVVPGMEQVESGIAVEATRDDRAAERCREVAENVLANDGYLDRDATVSDPVVYRVEAVDDSKPTAPEGGEVAYTFHGTNFERVDAGEVYMTGEDGSEFRAEEPFWPVIMSGNGYDGIFGFRARKIGPVSEL